MTVCKCGMPVDDVTHDVWHGVLVWNRAIFDRAAAEAAARFDEELVERDRRAARAEPQAEPAGLLV